MSTLLYGEKIAHPSIAKELRTVLLRLEMSRTTLAPDDSELVQASSCPRTSRKGTEIVLRNGTNLQHALSTDQNPSNFSFGKEGDF